MIYSQDNNFLLIKNKKVGGTSLEVELSKVLPKNAIVTPIFPSNINHQPRNHKNIFYNHISYSEIENLLDLKNVMSYVVVRNPYDVVLSAFFHSLHRKLKTPTYEIEEKTDLSEEVNLYFKEFSLHMWPEGIDKTHKLYTKNDRIIVNKILYYENGIENEINKILIGHNIKPIQITTFEKKYKPEWATFEKIFNREQINIINNKHAWEFDNLEYSSV